MRHFIIRIAVFLALVACLAAATECFVRSLPNSYKLKDAWMKTHADSVECVILGNSHALFAFRPDMMGRNVFNLANVSQTLDYDYLLLQHYVSACHQLRTAIINVDNSNLFDPSVDEAEPNRATFYRLYMDIDRHSLLSKYGFELASAATVQAKLQKHIAGIDLDVDSLGWGCTYKSELRADDCLADDKVKERMKGHTCTDWRNALANRRSLLAIAHFCMDRNISLIIVQTPTSRAYNRYIPTRQSQFISKTLSECSDRYKAIVIDLHDDDSFSDTDFFDADHMTDKAAAKLSRRFNLNFNLNFNFNWEL